MNDAVKHSNSLNCKHLLNPIQDPFMHHYNAPLLVSQYLQMSTHGNVNDKRQFLEKPAHMKTSLITFEHNQLAIDNPLPFCTFKHLPSKCCVCKDNTKNGFIQVNKMF